MFGFVWVCFLWGVGRGFRCELEVQERQEKVGERCIKISGFERFM